MATTIINPAASNTESEGSGVGFLVGIIVLAVLAVIFFVYGLPLLQGAAGNDTTEVNVPKSIDVNVNQPK